MHNQENSQSTPVLSGSVSEDFEKFFTAVNQVVVQPSNVKKAWEIIYYNAYLACYNRLMSVMREEPEIIVRETLKMREELINYLKLD